MKKRNLFVLIIIFLFVSCTLYAPYNMMNPSGERVKIISVNNNSYNGELMCVKYSKIIFSSNNKIYSMQFDKILKISIEKWDYVFQTIGMKDISLKYLLMTPLIIANGYFSAVFTSSFQISKEVILFDIFTGGALITMIVEDYINYSYNYNFTPPFLDEKIDRLKLYSRFPQGLDDENLKKLFDYYKQQEIIIAE